MKFPLKAFFSVLASAALCVPVFAGEPGGVVRFVEADAVRVAQFDASEPGSIAQVGHHAAACGCEVAPAPVCGCEPVCAAPSSCGGGHCGHRGRHHGILHMLGLHNCHHNDSCCSTPACAEPACGCEVEAACGCEPTCEAPACAAPAPACGCEPTCAVAPSCGSCSGHRHCGHRRSLLDVLFSCKHRGGCCGAPSCCEEPACGCEVEAACGCEPTCAAAPACADSCSGGHCGHGGRHHCCHRPILSLLGLHRCGGHGHSGCCAEVACAAPVCGVEPNCGAATYASPEYASPAYAEPNSAPAAMPMPQIEPEPRLAPEPALQDVPPAPPSPSDMPAGGADVSSSRSKWYSVK